MTDDINDPLSDPEIQAAVKAAAKAQAAATIRAAEISRRGDEIYDQAEKEFGKAKLDKALGNFKAFDGMKVELAEALFDAPEAHKVLYEISKSPDLIDKLYKMPPTKMIAEVARMGERIANGGAKKEASGNRGGGDEKIADPRNTDNEMADWLANRERELAGKRKAQRGGIRVY
jgi:hypothetical protein